MLNRVINKDKILYTLPCYVCLGFSQVTCLTALTVDL